MFPKIRQIKYKKIIKIIYRDYLVKIGRTINERSADHCKDKQSHLLRHALNNNHKTVDLKDLMTPITITISSNRKSQKPCILKNTNHL